MSDCLSNAELQALAGESADLTQRYLMALRSNMNAGTGVIRALEEPVHRAERMWCHCAGSQNIGGQPGPLPNGALPGCLITLQRRGRYYGYFSARRFLRRETCPRARMRSLPGGSCSAIPQEPANARRRAPESRPYRRRQRPPDGCHCYALVHGTLLGRAHAIAISAD